MCKHSYEDPHVSYAGIPNFNGLKKRIAALSKRLHKLESDKERTTLKELKGSFLDFGSPQWAVGDLAFKIDNSGRLKEIKLIGDDNKPVYALAVPQLCEDTEFTLNGIQFKIQISLKEKDSDN